MTTLRVLTRGTVAALLLFVILSSDASAQCLMPQDQDDRNEDESWFWFNEFQYFRHPRAAVRAPSIYAQLIPRADTVPSSGGPPDPSDPHPFEGQEGVTQVEAGFGAEVPIVGYVAGESDCVQGFDLFLYSSVHTLLRLTDRDIINSDFGFGAGTRFRLWFWDRVTGRLRWKHESTHLGDEYTFKGAIQRDLRGYNVSTEALELFLAIDNAPEFRRVDWYARAYGGATLLMSGLGGFDRTAEGRGSSTDGSSTSDKIPPLRYKSAWEFTLGGGMVLNSHWQWGRV